MTPGKAMRCARKAYRVLGVDFTTIPGISVLHVQAVVAEVGPDFPNSAALLHSVPGWDCVPTMTSVAAKYYGAEPERSEIVLAVALRMAAQSLQIANPHWASSIAECSPTRRSKGHHCSRS